MIEQLPRVAPPVSERDADGLPDHPMRKVTRQVAFEDGWDAERAGKVTELFNTLAPEWHTRVSEERTRVLIDALERGGAEGRICLEVGSGIGSGTAELAKRFDRVFAFDIASEMLKRAPAQWPRVRADGARLPVPDARADSVVLVNALLFPAEIERVLAPTGTLVWVNSAGIHTPIHLSAEDVERALPGVWSGCASEAADGTWCVLHRDA